MSAEPTLVILRRGMVPNDRKPRRIKPGDYFAVVINSVANRGKVPAVTSYFDDSFAGCWSEVPLSYYYDSAPAKLEEVPPALLQSLEEIEPPGPIVYRKRITRDEYSAMWRW